MISFPEKETILLLGGTSEYTSLNTLLVLGSNGKNWKKSKINLPYAVYNHGAQFLNNNLYIFGGKNADGKSTNSTYKLSQTLQWEKQADMNDRRFGISNSSVILNNQIWVLGGRNEKSLKSVEVYSAITNRWKYMRLAV